MLSAVISSALSYPAMPLADVYKRQGFDSSAFAERINVSRTDIPGTNLVIACFKRFVLTKEIARDVYKRQHIH